MRPVVALLLAAPVAALAGEPVFVHAVPQAKGASGRLQVEIVADFAMDAVIPGVGPADGQVRMDAKLDCAYEVLAPKPAAADAVVQLVCRDGRPAAASKLRAAWDGVPLLLVHTRTGWRVEPTVGRVDAGEVAFLAELFVLDWLFVAPMGGAFVVGTDVDVGDLEEGGGHISGMKMRIDRVDERHGRPMVVFAGQAASFTQSEATGELSIVPTFELWIDTADGTPAYGVISGPMDMTDSSDGMSAGMKGTMAYKIDVQPAR